MNTNKLNNKILYIVDLLTAQICKLALPYIHPENVKAMSNNQHLLSAQDIPHIPAAYAGDSPLQIVCRDIYLSGAFDSDWYIDTYRDIKQDAIDPLLHYVEHGAVEGRNPSEWFNSSYYNKQYEDVEQSKINPLHHYILHGWKEGRHPNDRHEREGYKRLLQAIFAKNDDIEEVLLAHKQAITESHTDELIVTRHLALADLCMKCHHWPHAEEALKNAVVLNASTAKNYDLLAQCLRRQGKWWQEIVALEKATALDDTYADWWFRLGEAREAMERWDGAAKAFQQAIALDGQWAEWHYRLGYVFERNALPRPAQEAYAEAIAKDAQLKAKQFGIGIFHEKRGYWHEALQAYEKHLRENPSASVELHVKLAVAYHRCYDMEKAAAANYNVLIATGENEIKLRTESYYRLGIVNERMGKLELAEQAYARSVELTPNKYRSYRLGYVLSQMGRHEDACLAYLKIYAPTGASNAVELPDSSELASELLAEASPVDDLHRRMAYETISNYTQTLEKDTTRTELYFLRGAAQEAIGDMAGAAESYAAGMARQNDHWAEGWYRLGKTLYACGRIEDACKAFANVEILRKPYWVDKKHYNNSRYFKIRADYLEYCECLPIDESIILYDSHGGNNMADNPYTLFKYILKNFSHQYMHVWSVQNASDVEEKFKCHSNVIFVRRDSDAYIRYIAIAKTIISDSTLPTYFTRRKGQHYVNTWHGTPMKTLGKDIIDEPLSSNNVYRNFLQSTIFVHPNKYTETILLSKYDIDNLYDGYSTVTGYPRIDDTLISDPSLRQHIKEQIGIANRKSKIILYAPTFRGLWNEAEISQDYITDVAECVSILKNYCLLFRGHYTVEESLKIKEKCIVVPKQVSTNELLSIVDVLITDYSSICFDFMPTNRPIIYYTPDFEEYTNTRGLAIDPSSLPSVCCRTKEELNEILSTIHKWKPNQRNIKTIQKYCPHDDGKASERVVDVINNTPTKRLQQKKKRILFNVDFIPNGISISFLSLCNAIDKNKYDISILINKTLTENTMGAMQLIKQLDKRCRIFPTDRAMLHSLESRHIFANMGKRGSHFPAQEKCIKATYQREMQRIFGDTRFDVLIDFVGYSCHQTELFAFAPCNNKIVYLHNDMLAEYTQRFNYLKRIFSVYQHFNKLVSVSDSINELNRNNLSSAFSIDPEKFVAVPNMQRPEYVRQASLENLEDGDECLFDSGCVHFITLGRLSPEKNHEMLLYAFAIAHRRHPNTRLLILGQGPLKQFLTQKIYELGLENCVRLGGHKQNPYPYMRRANCFVFPSKYEGQGVVLYEAMALGLPIIATSIPTSIEVLASGKYGLLADDTAESFASGMETYLQNRLKVMPFDFTQYQQNAMQAFEKLL